MRVAEANLLLPVADFAAPTPAALEKGLGELLTLMADRPDLAVYIGCRAGIGRTGMMIAALAKIAGIVDPIGWVRTYYHPDAVETAAQRAAIAMLDVARIGGGASPR